MNEFDAIARYFDGCGATRPEVLVGIGDDAALLRCGDGSMAVCTDTLVEGVHFAAGADPADVGYKALAVNLSDLAAMGAEPVWATLNLTVPSLDDAWLRRFAAGFFDLAREFGVALAGGDTTRGPLVISVQVGGHCALDGAIRRCGAKAGDAIYVSGPIGDGWLGLAVEQGRYRPTAPHAGYLLQRLRRPRPEVAVGLAIAGLATAAIDVSDGLLADLGHVLRASGGLGATLDLPAALFSEAAQPWLAESASPLALVAGGDDYRLCFCVARRDAGRLVEVTQGACEPVHIGYVEAEPGLRVSYRGTPLEVEEAGYDHFGGTADAT